MHDKDMFDYYGVNLRTYEDEECTEIMKDAINEMLVDDIFIDLLEEYAPKLFNTLPTHLDPSKVMHDLLDLLHLYCRDVSASVCSSVMERYHTTHRKKSEKDRTKAFLGHIESLQKLCGGGLAIGEKGIDLKRILEDAYDKPKEYIMPRYQSLSASTKPIDDYIKSLSLPNKKEYRELFIKQINTILPPIGL